MRALLLLAVVMVVAAAACGGGGESFPRVVTLGGDGQVFVSITNNSLGVGPNRVSMRLTDAADEPILGAAVRVRFYDLNGDTRRTYEADARFVAAELSYEDEQSGGERVTSGTDGVYVVNVDFARAGDWGLKLDARTDAFDEHDVSFRFNVLERTEEPNIGEEAPRSVQQTLSNAASITDIDSSSPPRPYMHDLTIADAIAARRPSVIAFATPAFCTSRTCAPVMDTVMDPLYERYRERASFVHVEPYVLADLRAAFIRTPVPTALEWRLSTEPWVFVVGGDGRIVGRFEGIVALDEVETALRAALGEG